MRIRSFFCFGLAAALAACGGGGGGGDDTQLIDAGPDIDSAPAHQCHTPSDYGTPTLTVVGAQGAGTADAPTQIRYEATLNTDAQADYIDIQAYKGYTVFQTAIAPGTYTLSGDELGFDTCGLCVVVTSDIDTTANTTQETYMPTGGTVELTETGANFTGTFTNLQLREVTIDQTTNVTTPVDGGCTTTIANGSFTSPVTYQ